MTTNGSGRRRIDGHTLLIVMSAAALPAWGALLLFTRYVPPRTVPAFVVFFLLLGMALVCTFSPLIYLVTRRILPGRTVRHAIRQAGLISVWVVFNLLLRVLHSWNIFTAIVSFAIIVVIEILALGRK